MGKKIFEESHESKKLLATVGGMKIYSDSIYVITGKMDEEAPSGYRYLGRWSGSNL